MVESGSRPEEASGLRIDAVEVLPTDLRSVLLRVAGAWEGPRPPDLEAPALVLREGAREHRIAALPETSGAAARAAPEPQAFRAAFSVRDALAPLLEDETAELDLGPVTVRLPPPGPSGEEAEADEAEGTVVDPAVLAERRARRAEQVEQANAQRAGDAERAAAKLEGELGKLELRLAAATEERARLEERLADRERAVQGAPSSGLAVLRREAALAAALRSTRPAPPPAAAPGPVLAAALEAERRLLARTDGLDVAQ